MSIADTPLGRAGRFDMEQIRAWYWEDGESLRQIARRLGTTPMTVQLHMAAAGIPRREPGYNLPPPRKTLPPSAELAALYAELGTVKAVAARVGYSGPRVGKVLRDAGVQVTHHPRRQHGTALAYRDGCGCAPCTAAGAQTRDTGLAAYRAKQAASLAAATKYRVPWTQDELEVAARTDLTAQEVAAELGRTLSAVIRVRAKLVKAGKRPV